MGIPGIVALMAINNARAISASSTARENGGTSCGWAQPNRYGDQYREQIISSVIRRSRPRWYGGIGFNVCPLNDAAPVLNVQICGNDAYRLLDAYHCVGYWRIPREIRRRIPELIREALTPEAVK
jgi:hypothetical protein